jgi:hypothetical protein
VSLFSVLLVKVLSSSGDGCPAIFRSCGITTRLLAGRPRNRGSIPGRDKRDSLPDIVQTCSGAHAVSCTVGTVGSFTGDKAAGA